MNKAPFPLLDLSSMLLSIGIEPLVDRETLIKEKISGNKHNAMYDVDVMIAVWKQYFKNKWISRAFIVGDNFLAKT